MLRYKLKRLLEPLRLMGRRGVLLPTFEEQSYVSARGCIYTAATFINRNYVAGDYLEFGVWKGHSFIKAYHAITDMRRRHMAWLSKHPTQQSEYGKGTPDYELWKSMQPRFFAFDSFKGLPESAAGDFHEGWAKGSFICSQDQFTRNIVSEGVKMRDVTMVEGFYDQSLTPDLKKKLNLKRAAVVHVDCDLYDSTTTVLDWVTDLLTQGSIIIFDDWFCYQGRPDCGEQKACKDWLARNPHLELIEYWREPPQPMSFIVNFRR